MREIKFRLRLDNKIVGYEKWYSGERAPDENRPEERYWRANPCWLYSEDGKYWKPTPIFHNHKDQYTGLKDKNGVEVYEGDILRASPHNKYVVIFRDGAFAEIHSPDDGWIHWLKDARETRHGKDFVECEVIGNI